MATGVSRCCGIDRRRRRNSSPSRSGIRKSRMSALGRLCSASSNPSVGLAAVKTSYPSRRSIRANVSSTDSRPRREEYKLAVRRVPGSCRSMGGPRRPAEDLRRKNGPTHDRAGPRASSVDSALVSRPTWGLATLDRVSPRFQETSSSVCRFIADVTSRKYSTIEPRA